MTSKTLSKSEIKQINQELQGKYNQEFFNKKDFVQLITEPIKHIKKNKEPTFFYDEEQELVPFLKFLHQNPFLKKITVDMGAVKYVCSGADIMRPGITEIEPEIKENEIIMIIDEKNKKPISVGKTIHTGEQIKEQITGKVIKNLHYVTDDKWEL